MNESKLERRVDAKRPDVEPEWNEPARFNALGIAETWSVTVEAEGKRLLSIGDQYVAGLVTDELEPFSATIRSCAMHLLGFIGAGPVAACAEPAYRAPAAATVLTDERIEAELHRIAAYWEDQARRGCVDAFQCALREAWNVASRAHAGVTAEPAAPVQRIPDMLTVETIQGAIAFGRMGINPPPSPDHWGNEFWQIGRQLAKLGETSAWDNVTPVDVGAQVPAAEVRAAEWQPIATVPMDGSEVLLYLPAPYNRVVKARWFDIWENWIEGEFPDPHDEYCGIGSLLPTYWMNLPAAPSTADSAGTGAMGEGADR